MAFCEKCGIPLNDGANFCSACGASAANGAATQTDPKDARENKAMAVIVYFPFLFIVPLLTGEHKNSPFVKFHANQGAALSIAFIAALILLTFISIFIPIIGMIVVSFLLSPIIGIGWLVLCIYGIISALNGTLRPLPLIGGLKIIK